MMFRNRKDNVAASILAAITIAFFASACVSNGYDSYGRPMGMGPNQLVGAAIGGATGGFLGNQIGRGSGRNTMTALGAVGGILLGSEIGRNMDMQQTQQRVYQQPQYGHPSVIYAPPSVVYVPMSPPIYYGGGFAQCDAMYGETSQARADCVRAIADQRARQDAFETQNQRRRYGY